MNFLANIGRAVMAVLAHIGSLAVFTGRSLAALFSPPIYTRLILGQMLSIGYYSLPVVGLTAFFTGGVLALQIYLGGNRFGAEAIVPQVVVIGITRELGPVIAGLMIAGRVAAAIAAEIGTMRVTEQIDALTTLSTNPIKYLVVPRLIAAVISNWFLMQGFRMSMTPGVPRGASTSLFLISAVMGGAIGLLYPVALMIVLMSRTVREYYNSVRA